MIPNLCYSHFTFSVTYLATSVKPILNPPPATYSKKRMMFLRVKPGRLSARVRQTFSVHAEFY